MNYLVFSDERNHYPVALLCKYLRPRELAPYVLGIEDDVVAYSIPTAKSSNKEIKEYLSKLLPILCELQVEYVIVTDGEFFKVLTKSTKVDRFCGYVLPCVLDGFKHLNIIYTPSPQQLMYAPELWTKAQQGLRALKLHRAGTYMPPGIDIIKFAEYPDTIEEIGAWLEKLLDTELAIDIEAYSLKHYSAGIGTISLAWNEHEGIAFSVDKDNPPEKAWQIRYLLRLWFEARIAKTLYHGASYDVYVLIYQLFMEHLHDTAGLLYGLEIMLRSWEDTKLIRYLATNSCGGNKLSLKDVTQEFAGNYAVDVEDITIIPLPQLLEYNLIDSLGTWYAFNKHYQQMVHDQQLDIYENLFKPALIDIIQMQLTGMPMDMEAVASGKKIMEDDRDTALATIAASPVVAQVEAILNQRWVDKRNSELKVKRVSLADAKEKLNLNSGPQIALMLYEVMGLPILETTDKGHPATGMDAVHGLIFHAQSDDHKAVLEAIIGYKLVEKILSSFIPAFEQAQLAPDGAHYLYGAYNLGGTISGRLSSSNPNMQNLPANAVNPLTGKPSKYAKLVKLMFRAPKGKQFVGLDFASLEDKISALTTKDPNKLKVYTDGYDGHSLRAFSYFGDQMEGIDPDSVDSINSIQDKYKPLRQDSKAPTFALTYQGTWRTLMANCGFSEEKAQLVEGKYHEMYRVSDEWVQTRLAQAGKDGYVTVAFGLRLRTPMLKQSVMGTKKTPYEAVAEGRTAGNAMGQSYCLLTSRAGIEFNRKVRAHPEYRLKIWPCSQIHDAQYFVVEDDADLIAWMNVHLVEAVQWQELPEIQHDEVKLGGELSVFYPTWATELTIPNGADAAQILKLAEEHITK